MEKLKELPLVSIIVPIYNTKEYLWDCYKSIHSQTYQNYELILVDDGSTDGSSELCDKIALTDNKVIVIHQENRGVAYAREAGIHRAEGMYTLFVDSDDWIDSKMLEYMLENIGQAELISVGVFREWSKDNVYQIHDKFEDGFWDIKNILGRMIYDFEAECIQPLTPWIVNKLFLTKIIKNIHTKTNIHYAEDSVFLYQYMLQIKCIRIAHTPFYHYRYRENSAIHSVNDRMLIDINNVYLTLKPIFTVAECSESLIIQLEKWIKILTYLALDSHMGFKNCNGVIQFIGDFGILANKKIILYGAGKCGRDYKSLLDEFKYDIILWVDRDALNYRRKGLLVNDISEISNYEYDVICLAVSDFMVANEIKKDLLNKGIKPEKVYWKKPLRLF